MCSIFGLFKFPHFLYQAPPGAQQLSLPDFELALHFGHLVGSVVVESVLVGTPVVVETVLVGTPAQARTPSSHV